jgi:hypothetical protein
MHHNSELCYWNGAVLNLARGMIATVEFMHVLLLRLFVLD